MPNPDTAGESSASQGATDAAAGLAQGVARAVSITGGEEACQAEGLIQSAGAAIQSATGLQRDGAGSALGIAGGLAGAVGAMSRAAQVRQATQVAAAALEAAGTAYDAVRSATTTSGNSPHDARADGGADPAGRNGVAATGRDREDVSASLEIDGVDGVLLGVREATISEALNEVPLAIIEIRCDGALPEMRELLHRDCFLSVERSSQVRSFRGVVQHAETHETSDGTILTLRVAPAMAYLEHIVDTRIYQDMTVLDVLQELFNEKLGDRCRQIRNECGTHEVHEYLVQYNESCLAFVGRLLELEGIFYYFDHEGDHEVLVLTDTVSSCLTIRENGDVPFAVLAEQVADHEAITSVHHTERVGSISTVVSGYDWTNPPLRIQVSQVGRGQAELPLERYVHREAVTHHGYQGGQYRSHSAAVQAQMRVARLDQEREQWRMTGTVVTAQPGRILALSGAPDPALDDRYLILEGHTEVVLTEGTKGSLTQSLEVYPADRPYVPPCRTPVPVVHGMESATVVGPDGGEVYTDEHGRIKVQFPWDRHGEGNEASSCWLRVAQMWGGACWGTHFTPRIGMEVIVAFLGGHPDRPVVVGSLYNGTHRPPYVPASSPGALTKSTIRTSSIPGGDGFNELRFDDDAGNEEIFIHAQKDMNETVLNNHSQSVKVNQKIEVGGNQSLTVTGNQDETVDGDQLHKVVGKRVARVEKNEELNVTKNRTHTIGKNEKLTVTGTRTLDITGHDKGEFKAGREADVTGDDNIVVSQHKTTRVGQKYTITAGGQGHFRAGIDDTDNVVYLKAGEAFVSSTAKTQVKSPGARLLLEGNDAKLIAAGTITLESGPCKIEIGNGKVAISAPALEVMAGGSQLTLDSSGAVVAGTTSTRVSASAMVTIMAGIVSVN